jgi:hypothetical protein
MTDRLPYAPGSKQYAGDIEMYSNTPPSEGGLTKEEGTGTFTGVSSELGN